MDFESIYRLYFHDVFLYMKGIAANEEIAEEVTQETFMKALKAIDSFDGSKDIRAWLFTIAKNTYFTYCKKQRIFMDEDFSEEIADNTTSILKHLSNEEDAFSIHQFLHSMAEPYKEVFLLRVFGELPFCKIGRIFGKSDGWARVTYHRAKRQIMKYMEEINSESDEL